jgi:hypothetical protein
MDDSESGTAPANPTLHSLPQGPTMARPEVSLAPCWPSGAAHL